MYLQVHGRGAVRSRILDWVEEVARSNNCPADLREAMVVDTELLRTSGICTDLARLVLERLEARDMQRARTATGSMIDEDGPSNRNVSVFLPHHLN